MKQSILLISITILFINFNIFATPAPNEALLYFQNQLRSLDEQILSCPEQNLTESQKNALLTQAFNWYYKKANQGDADAAYYVAQAYYYPLGANFDLDAAYNWLLKSANKNNVAAMYRLAMINYAGGIEVPQGKNSTKKKAIFWFMKAAEKNDAKSQLMLAVMYANGWFSLKKDDSKAFYWLSKAVTQSNADAIATLGDFYYSGIHVKQNYQQAFSYYKQALSMPNLSIPTRKYVYQKLIIMYTNALGVPKSKTEAKLLQENIINVEKNYCHTVSKK